MIRNPPLDSELAASLTLLCADAIAFTPKLTAQHREILVGALLEASVHGVTEKSEANWFRRMLEAGMQTTAPYKEESHVYG